MNWDQIMTLINYVVAKTGENQGRTPGKASDYTLRIPNSLDSCRHDKTFY